MPQLFPPCRLRFNSTGICSSSLLKNPRQNESSLIQFFYHESVEARMRGAFTDQGQLFSYLSPEARVRTDHPLRKIRELVRDVLGELNRSLSRLYACEGRPSIRCPASAARRSPGSPAAGPSLPYRCS